MADTLKNLQGLLVDLVNKWDQFALEAFHDKKMTPPSEYERGIAVGFNIAGSELRALLNQLENETPDLTLADTPIEIKPAPAVADPKPEYLYVTFEQAPDGTWRLKHLNGVWQPNWEHNLTFDEVVRRLSQQGWKLARFANGIHIFKRDHAPK